MNAVKRQKWQSSKFSKVCGAHFVEGRPHSNPEHPDYVPTFFPCVYGKKLVKTRKPLAFKQVPVSATPTGAFQSSCDPHFEEAEVTERQEYLFHEGSLLQVELQDREKVKADELQMEKEINEIMKRIELDRSNQLHVQDKEADDNSMQEDQDESNELNEDKRQENKGDEEPDGREDNDLEHEGEGDEYLDGLEGEDNEYVHRLESNEDDNEVEHEDGAEDHGLR